jgi:aryl-alcohol dehydrogenase-like predicted oxidoreductase
LVAELGIGLAALGRPAYITLEHQSDFADGRSVSALRERSHEVLDAAWAAGIRHIDAARSYGRAEEFVGSWLRAHPDRRDAVTVSSKWGYTYVADWQVDADTHEVKDHSVETLARQWRETLDALGTRPDLYLVHSVTPDSPALSDRGVLDRLWELAEEGVRVGISTSGPEQDSVVKAALALGDNGPFAAVQATWNLLEPSVEPALGAAIEAGWHVALKETVANGRLTSRGEPPRELVDVARHHGVGVDAIAVAAALGAPAAVVLLGVTTVEQLDSNLDGATVELSSSDKSQLRGLAEDAAAYWSTRAVLPWT